MRQSKNNLSSILLNHNKNAISKKGLMQPIFSSQNLEQQKQSGVSLHGIAGQGITAAKKAHESIVLNQKES